MFMERITPNNCALLLIDHQVGLCTGVRDMPIETLKHNVVGLAKAAIVMDIPIVAATTGRDYLWGPTIPELLAVLDGVEIIDRNALNAWDEPRFVKAVETTKRKNLIIAGLSLGVCALLPALSALRAGYQPYVPIDACGTFDLQKREAGVARLVQSEAVVSDVFSLMCEIMADNAAPFSPKVYEALDIPFGTLMGQVAAGLNRTPAESVA
jgi:nicotinamidase-related amidase